MTTSLFAVRDVIRKCAPIPVTLSDIIIMYAVSRGSILTLIEHVALIGQSEHFICPSSRTALTIFPSSHGVFQGMIKLDYINFSWTVRLLSIEDDPLGTLLKYERNSAEERMCPFTEESTNMMYSFVESKVAQCFEFLLKSDAPNVE